MQSNSNKRNNTHSDKRETRMRGPMIGAGIGVFVLALAYLYFSEKPATVPQDLNQPPPQVAVETVPAQVAVESVPTEPTPQKAEHKDFITAVFDDTETTWRKVFRNGGRNYQSPRLLQFRDTTTSACMSGLPLMGAFYCPLDQTVYLDLSYLDAIKNRFGASSDLAHAYVIAHVLGHHVQSQLGITEKAEEARSQLPEDQVNQMQDRLELLTDCIAGVWANHSGLSRQLLESGSIENAIGAASTIGKERQLQQTQGRIMPEGFTHATAEQRIRWFNQGLKNGKVSGCDTFEASEH